MNLLQWEDSRIKKSCFLLAPLFSLFTIGGFYFENLKNGLPEIFLGRPWVLYAVLVFAALSICFALTLKLVFRTMGRIEQNSLLTGISQKKCRYGLRMEEKPFLTSFLSLCMLYIPYAVLSYPGIFMGDVGKTMMQGFGIWGLFSQQPPIYTLLVSGLVKAGFACLHTWNAGAMTAAVIQMVVLLAVIAWGNRLLIRRGVRWEAAVLFLVYYAISLIVSNYMMLLTKDVWYVAFFFLWVQGLADVITDRVNTKHIFPLTVGMLGMLAFRNEAILVLLLSLLFCAITDRKHVKRLLAFAVEATALYGVLMLMIYPALGIHDDGIDENSRRDLFSPVFQQTARTVQTHRDEITPEEEAAILNAFSFESLEEMADAYSPDYADNVKNEFNARFGSEEAERYFQTWREMGKKYPRSYVMATLANTYQYVYPFSPFWVYTYDYSADNMALVNDMLGFTDFHYPDTLSHARQQYEKIREAAYSVLPLSMFNGSGVVVWIMMILTAWVLARREKEKSAMLIPLWVVFVLCLFSPCNGSYGRYQYPIFISLPWIFMLCLLPKEETQ